MTKPFLILASLALVSGPAFAGNDSYQSQGKVTLNTQITSEGPDVNSSGGTKRNLVTTRFGNRQILLDLVENETIPTIIGYTLVERFDGEGNRIDYYAVNPATGDEQSVGGAVMELISTNGVSSLAYNSRTDKTTSKVKTHSTLALEEYSLSLLENISLASSTVRLGKQSVPFLSATVKGNLQGNLEDGEVIDGTLNVARSTIYLPTT